MAWNRSQRRLADTATDVYRIYDEIGRLLYVGASVNVFTRMREHKQYAQWWSSADNGTVVRYQSRRVARVVEARAIEDERPLFNVTHERAELLRAVEVVGALERFEVFFEDGQMWVLAEDETAGI